MVLENKPTETIDLWQELGTDWLRVVRLEVLAIYPKCVHAAN